MKKFLAALCIVILSATSVSAAFEDVDESTNYAPAIQWLEEQDIIDGYSDGYFRPERCVARAEMLKIIFEAKGVGGSSITNTQGFWDVRGNEWFMPYLYRALNEGVITGYPDGTFKGENCVNRVEGIKMALEAFEINEHRAAIDPWLDIDESQWYYAYFATAIYKNLLGLEHVYRPNSYFGPNDEMSRAEVSEMIYRIQIMQLRGDSRYEEIYPIPYEEPYE